MLFGRCTKMCKTTTDQQLNFSTPLEQYIKAPCVQFNLI